MKNGSADGREHDYPNECPKVAVSNTVPDGPIEQRGAKPAEISPLKAVLAPRSSLALIEDAVSFIGLSGGAESPSELLIGVGAVRMVTSQPIDIPPNVAGLHVTIPFIIRLLNLVDCGVETSQPIVCETVEFEPGRPRVLPLSRFSQHPPLPPR